MNSLNLEEVILQDIRKVSSFHPLMAWKLWDGLQIFFLNLSKDFPSMVYLPFVIPYSDFKFKPVFSDGYTGIL
jgi:hypothetical protein